MISLVFGLEIYSALCSPAVLPSLVISSLIHSPLPFPLSPFSVRFLSPPSSLFFLSSSPLLSPLSLYFPSSSLSPLLSLSFSPFPLSFCSPFTVPSSSLSPSLSFLSPSPLSPLSFRSLSALSLLSPPPPLPPSLSLPLSLSCYLDLLVGEQSGSLSTGVIDHSLLFHHSQELLLLVADAIGCLCSTC